MKVLVTGGTGFVGAWTAKAAQDAGHQVRFLVRSLARLGGLQDGGAPVDITYPGMVDGLQRVGRIRP